MQLIKLGRVAFAAVLTLSFPVLSLAQTATQDMKNAGTDTKNATKSAGHGVATGTKKTYHKTKRGTKKAYHKTTGTAGN